MRKLKEIDGGFFFTKEAMSLRGYPDILGCYKGRFIALEVKRSKADSTRETGRVPLQKYILDKITDSGGFASFIYPENEEEVFKNILSI
jgi:penicillin-binding protein-related factor A (putative recombinase)